MGMKSIFLLRILRVELRKIVNFASSVLTVPGGAHELVEHRSHLLGSRHLEGGANFDLGCLDGEMEGSNWPEVKRNDLESERKLTWRPLQTVSK